MKKFNQVISVEVAVDDIANQLLSNINPEFAHRELVAETIIGLNLERGGLGMIYSALHGWEDTIDIKIDSPDNIYPTYMVEDGEINFYSRPEENKDKNIVLFDGKRYVPVIVKAVNKYTNSSDKVHVKYWYENKKGETVSDTTWVNHKRMLLMQDSMSILARVPSDDPKEVAH